jgi:hypothetical protein
VLVCKYNNFTHPSQINIGLQLSEEIVSAFIGCKIVRTLFVRNSRIQICPNTFCSKRRLKSRHLGTPPMKMIGDDRSYSYSVPSGPSMDVLRDIWNAQQLRMSILKYFIYIYAKKTFLFGSVASQNSY